MQIILKENKFNALTSDVRNAGWLIFGTSDVGNGPNTRVDPWSDLPNEKKLV